MRSPGSNVTSVTSVTLDGLVQLSDHRWLFFVLFLSAYLFVLVSDGLVVYVIWSQRSLHRPMFMFVAAVLVNSLVASAAVYPGLLSDLASGRHVAEVSRAACLSQGFVVYSLGSSSFVLLAAMAFDRYLSICRPLRYAALVTPAAVAALLLLCWLLPAGLVGGAVLLASRLPLCRSRISRIYCDIYSFVHLSCGGGGAVLLFEVYGLLCAATTVFLPAAFVLFTYGRILFICLRRSRAFSSKALRTCLPHLLVFLNYSLSAGAELLQRRLQAGGAPAVSILPSVLVLVVPTVFNPVVYGLKVQEVFRHVRRLLSCRAPGQSSDQYDR
ncbi:olfactory receptor 11A1-like protein [Lates japonicus]|uniref:Olfactory receptor n=2 Tax=Lates japonicus TaxID=270547 RepID=A0AAD3NGA2_LATJO|nr:olfactory receptor 11A1-like protein [Lates japonicus]